MTVMKKLLLHWLPRFWVVALFNAPVWAVGLGELTVHSHLNEPLRGEVPLFDSEHIEISNLRVELASEEEFQRVGAERVFWLTQLRFELQAEGAEKRILLTTDGPLREPYLDFVIALGWPQGRLLRDYTALIDLPPPGPRGEEFRSHALPDAISQVSDTASPSDDITQSVTETVPQSMPHLADPASASPPTAGSFYVVVQNDTLWRIASSIAPDRLSVEQVMLEIIRMNPQAFQQQNVNGLKAGYRLELPLNEDIEIERATAIDAVALQNNAWQVREEQEGLALGVSGASDATLQGSSPPAVEAESLELAPSPVLEPILVRDETSVTPPDEERALWVDQTSVAPTPLEPAVFGLNAESASMGASRADFEALTMTVGRLQLTLAELQEQISQRDSEVASLRALLALQDERLQAAVTALAKRNDLSLRDRLVSAATSPGAGLVALLCLVLCLSWFYRRRQTVLAKVPAESAADQSDRMRATAAIDANAAVDGSSGPQEHMSTVAPGLSVEQEDEGDPTTGLDSIEAETPAASEDSSSMTDAPTSADEDSFLVDRNRGLGGASERLTRDDLSLAPADALSPEYREDGSIYGLETDPVDSQLDLARAYIDMGDEESAHPVLTQVIEQGSLSQQAEARALLNRLDVS
jgi:pilus assembly protein FimV